MKTRQQHINNERKFSSILYGPGAGLKLMKCKLFTGHRIRPRRLKLASYTTNVNRRLQLLANLTKFRSCLASYNVFQRFVPNFAPATALLNQRLEKDQPASFTPFDSDEHCSIKTLKNELMYSPILVLAYFDGEMALGIDAYNFQVVCVFQE